MRELFVTPRFKKDYESIPPEVVARAEIIVKRLRENPTGRMVGAKKLQTVKSPVFRVRIGSFRLIYSFTKSRVVLLRFRNRKDVYRALT